jgi:hypothetical protein
MNEITECPECGHMARWVNDAEIDALDLLVTQQPGHWHCGFCGEDTWPTPPKEKP